jgi:hypothetical protein
MVQKSYVDFFEKKDEAGGPTQASDAAALEGPDTTRNYLRSTQHPDDQKNAEEKVHILNYINENQKDANEKPLRVKKEDLLDPIVDNDYIEYKHDMPWEMFLKK